MVSKIKADVFETSLGGPVNLTGQSAAKAWCSYTTITATSVRKSLNISSITDNGTGHSTLSFINSFSDADFCCPYNATDSGLNTGGINMLMSSSVGSVSLKSYQTSWIAYDMHDNHITIHGDLA